jgi:outer membrane lipoprotein-sorting protein
MLKQPKNIIYILLLLALCPLLLGWADSWEGIRKAAEGVKSIKADFVQEKHMKILKKPLIARGVFFYQLPDSLRWEYSTPFRSVLLMHADRIRRFIQGQDGMVEDSGASLEMMRFVLQEIPLWLSGRFDANPNFKAFLKEDNRIEMVPASAALTGIIDRIELVLADKPGIIDTVTIYESKDTFTRFLFRNTEMNAVLTDALFQEL